MLSRCTSPKLAIELASFVIDSLSAAFNLLEFPLDVCILIYRVVARLGMHTHRPVASSTENSIATKNQKC